jgi:CTP synthase
MLLKEQGLVTNLRSILALDTITPSSALLARGASVWDEWTTLTTAQDRAYDTVNIALVGKYNNPNESYLSVIKSVEHAAMHCRRKLNLICIDASLLETPARDTDPAGHHTAWTKLCSANGVLVPGGFGTRGTEGMMLAARWAREKKMPYLGICLGMQLAVCEFARNVCGISDATSTEFDPETKSSLIINMPEIDQVNLGGTMRLGLRPTNFQPNSSWSKLRALYGLGTKTILERHRHRFEVNPAYIAQLEEGGLNFIGKDDKGERMEIVEIRDHPWYVGVQFHPEYLSRVLAPSKPYLGFVAASAACLESVTKREGGSKRKLERTNTLTGVVRERHEDLVEGEGDGDGFEAGDIKVGQ